MTRGKQLSRHLSSKEVRCRCGCDLAHLQDSLVDGFEILRDLCSENLGRDCPISPSSGFRCTRHNESLVDPETQKRISSPFSKHLIGAALDLRTPKGMQVEEFAILAKQVPQFYSGGIGIYSWGIHVDVRGFKARWRG